jgi:hypothetical protein
MLDDTEVLRIVKGHNLYQICIFEHILMINMSYILSFKINNVDGCITGVEDNDFLISKHAKSANYTVVVIFSNDFALFIEMDNCLALPWLHNCREDIGIIISS